MDADRERNESNRENPTNDPRREEFPGAGNRPGQRPNPVTTTDGDNDMEEEDRESVQRPGQGQPGNRPNDPQRKPDMGGGKH